MRLFSANEGTLEPYLSQFDVEKLEMASVMGICGSLVGPKSGNVEKVLVFKAFWKEKGGSAKVGWGWLGPGPAECAVPLKLASRV